MNKPKLLAATIALLLLSSHAFAADKPEFISNGDGTITHTPTDLVWQACAVGQTWDASFATCTGEAKKFAYSDEDKIGAIQVTSDFAGQKDWRLPTIAELNTIIDAKRTSPAINKSFFPNTPAVNFWSSSVATDSPHNAWFVDFRDGYGYGNYYNQGDTTDGGSAIRFVRGGQSFSFVNLTDFVDNKNGTVTNNKTGLTWQRCVMGKTWNDGYCDGTATTYKQSDAAKLTSDLGGQTDWRLPTYKELLTIVDYGTSAPAINSTVFPDTPVTDFWTTTPKAEEADSFWNVGFKSGQGGYTSKTTEYSARLVRGTLWGNSTVTTLTGGVDLAPTITATPNPATVNGNITFTATLTNKGTATATDAKMSFGLPKNTVSLVTKPDDCNFTGLSVVCAVGNVVPNGSITKTVTVKMTKAGGLSFGVTSWANEKDVNMKDNIARTTVAIRK